uniref:Uncharacterized protein n=1 Tax=Mus spicilegus TaxID=10103 RepID=A0A8C6IB98_MUSSI
GNDLSFFMDPSEARGGLSRVHWHILVLSAIAEVGAGGSLEPRSLRIVCAPLASRCLSSRPAWSTE